MSVNAMRPDWISCRRDVELRDVLNAIRGQVQGCGGLAWMSRRYLCRVVLGRGNSRTLDLVDELVRRDKIRRVSAPGRGRGRGRTLYWLPDTRRSRVMLALRKEGMPHRAILAALRFFSQPRNGPLGDRQQTLRSSTFGSEPEEGQPALPARRGRSPDAPQLRVLTPPPGASTPPSLGRLSRHGFRWRGYQPVRPPEITNDPATHPSDCGCQPCRDRSATDKVPS